MEFVGKIDVKALNPKGFQIDLYCRGTMIPTHTITSDLDGQEFLLFLFKELQSRSLWRNEYYKINKVSRYD